MAADQTKADELKALREEVAALRASLARYEGSAAQRQHDDRHWRLLLDQSPDFISEIDRGFRIVYTNNLLPQFKMEDVIGKNVLDFVDPEYRQIYKENMERVFREGVAVRFEIVAVGANGTKAVYLNSIGPAWRDGKLNSLVIVSRNITELKAREEALRASEERFSKIFHSTPAAMGLSRLSDGKLIDANENLCTLMGFSREEMLGHTVVELNMYADADERHRKIQRLRETGSIRNELTVLRTKSGTLIHVLVSMVILKLSNEDTIVAMLHDVTEKYRAEQLLRESEERLRMALQTSQLGTWEWYSNRTQKVWDDRNHVIYGLEPGTFSGSREAYLACIHPDDRARVNEASVRLSQAEGVFNEEYRILRPDGSVGWVASRAKSFCDDKGNVVRLLGVNQDITDRKIGEEKLAESNQRLLLALREAKMVAFTWDIEADIVTRVGSSDTETTPRQLQDVIAQVHADDRALFVERVNAAVRDGREYASEHRMMLNSTEHRWVMEKGSISTDTSGRRKLNGIVADITEFKRLEEQLLQAQKMESIGRLAGGIAHDFNNLLTVVMVSVESLANGASGAAAEKHLQNIRDSANRAAGLTAQLLAFARKQMIQPRVLDLNEIARKMEALLCRLIGENIKLVSRYEPKLDCIRVDPTQIEQLIMNLAVNARDAMPGGGTLIIETRNALVTPAEAEANEGASAGPYVKLSISDSGSGMPEDVLKHLFEPFFTTKEIGRGTGLGLATCYGVVRQNGGHIRVRSELGKGSVFEIYLPRIETSSPGAPGSAAELPRTGTETVLLVEDEELLRSINGTHLRQLGYTVLEAGDGEEALRVAMASKQPIQLLVTDMIMPRLGGEELAMLLTQRSPQLRVLFVSGYADHAPSLHSNGTLRRYLQKPFTLVRLSATIRELLDATS